MFFFMGKGVDFGFRNELDKAVCTLLKNGPLVKIDDQLVSI